MKDNKSIEGESNSPARDDILSYGLNYFHCGWGKKEYYNSNFSIAVDLLGSIYKGKNSRGSDYHNGIAIIADKAEVSKCKVKALRKKMQYKGGFCFNSSYKTGIILMEMIKLLKDYENKDQVKQFLTEQSSHMYREILIEKEYEAIGEAARKGQRARVQKVADLLDKLTTKVSEDLYEN